MSEAGEPDPDDQASVDPLEVTYDEQFYPARPRALRPRARRRAQPTPDAASPFTPDARNAAYVAWLEDLSMLHDANVLSRQLSGQAAMWANSYAHPDPRAAVERASVWFTAYPLSLITAPGQTFLGALGDPALWDVFQKIGIEAIHTGPVKRAGGLSGWEYTPSVDGHFDRISMAIDPVFGTEDEFRTMCEVATEHGGVINRRHRAWAHGQGRRLSPCGDELQRLPGDLSHDQHPRSQTGICSPTCRRVAIRSTSAPKPRAHCRRPATSSASCNASSSTRRASRRRTGA